MHADTEAVRRCVYLNGWPVDVIVLIAKWATQLTSRHVVNTESRACLDHLTKWSWRHQHQPSVAQYAKLPEWATVLAVWHQCGWTVSRWRLVGGGRSWLHFGVIYSPTLAAATDSLLLTFPLSPCGVKHCAVAVTTDTQTVQRGCADWRKLSIA